MMHYNELSDVNAGDFVLESSGLENTDDMESSEDKNEEQPRKRLRFMASPSMAFNSSSPASSNQSLVPQVGSTDVGDLMSIPFK